MAPSTTTRSVPLRIAGTVLAFTAAVPLAGCGSEDKKDSTSPSSAPASADPDQDAKGDVLAAYTNMRECSGRALHTAASQCRSRERADSPSAGCCRGLMPVADATSGVWSDAQRGHSRR